MAPRIGYWKLRGFVNPIKYILVLNDVPFEEDHYVVSDGPEYSLDEWLSVKHKLGLPVPNLPYYIDGDVKICETHAILRYLARKYNLDARNEKERQILDMVDNVTLDLKYKFAQTTYNGDQHITKPKYAAFLDGKLQSIFDLLGDKKWILGDKLSYVDFVLYEVFHFNKKFLPEITNKYPRMDSFMKQVESLDKIHRYQNSSAFIAGPMNNKMAVWGNDQ